MTKPMRLTCQVCCRALNRHNCSEDQHTCVYCDKLQRSMESIDRVKVLQPWLSSIPQERALFESINFVWSSEKACDPRKCQIPCGTACILVTKRLALLGLLGTVMEWQEITKSKVGEDDILTIEDIREFQKGVRENAAKTAEAAPSDYVQIVRNMIKANEQTTQDLLKKLRGLE